LKDGGIGGSETALVQVATRMANDGWLVKVYSGAEPGLLGGVLYRPFSAFDPTEVVDLLVVSRMPHIFDNPIGVKKTALWCHDHQLRQPHRRTLLEDRPPHRSLGLAARQVRAAVPVVRGQADDHPERHQLARLVRRRQLSDGVEVVQEAQAAPDLQLVR